MHTWLSGVIIVNVLDLQLRYLNNRHAIFFNIGNVQFKAVKLHRGILFEF
jgi:hypothetical protein